MLSPLKTSALPSFRPLGYSNPITTSQRMQQILEIKAKREQDNYRFHSNSFVDLQSLDQDLFHERRESASTMCHSVNLSARDSPLHASLREEKNSAVTTSLREKDSPLHASLREKDSPLHPPSREENERLDSHFLLKNPSHFSRSTEEPPLHDAGQQSTASTMSFYPKDKRISPHHVLSRSSSPLPQTSSALFNSQSNTASTPPPLPPRPSSGGRSVHSNSSSAREDSERGRLSGLDAALLNEARVPSRSFSLTTTPGGFKHAEAESPASGYSPPPHVLVGRGVVSGTFETGQVGTPHPLVLRQSSASDASHDDSQRVHYVKKLQNTK